MSSDSVPDSQSLIDVFILFHILFGLLFAWVFRKTKLAWFVAIGLHQLFEIWENAPGVGGGHWFFSLPWLTKLASSVGLDWEKYEGDSAQNSAMDTLGFAVGLFCGLYLFSDLNIGKLRNS
jgi:hypothetical protein